MKLVHIIPMAGLVLLSACAGPSANTVQMAQERHSCAELGLDPGSEAFAQCVGNLDATMFEASNSAMR